MNLNIGKIIFDENIANSRVSTPFSPVPAGEYVVVIEKAEEKLSFFESMKPAHEQNPNATCLALTFQLIEGEFAKRKFFQDLRLPFVGYANTADKTYIDKAQINIHKLLKVLGLAEISSASDLIDLRLKVKVNLNEKGRNTVLEYYSCDQVLSFNTQAPAASGAPDWRIS